MTPLPIIIPSFKNASLEPALSKWVFSLFFVKNLDSRVVKMVVFLVYCVISKISLALWSQSHFLIVELMGKVK